MTISPSEWRSGLVLRLSRFRRQDTGIVHDDDGMRKWIAAERPALNQSNVIDLPQYTVRRAITSRDPLAVNEGFLVTIRTIVPLILGMRMCPLCPSCNANNSNSPCQDKFGSSAQPGGGSMGRCDALVGAVENRTTTGWRWVRRA